MTRFSKPLLVLAVVALFALALGLRFYDLTDQPIDFHPTRQLRSAIIARGMYYQMMPNPDPQMLQQAVSFWNSTGQYEPSFLERIVATTYLVIGREQLWVARIYSSLFWIIGGLALFFLARRMVNHDSDQASGNLTLTVAFVIAAYYLILPFGVQASRAFQPDPFMVMWFVLYAFCLYRWSETQSWRWALLAGLFGGLAVLIKIVAAYLVGGAAIALVLYTLGIKRFWRSLQVYMIAAMLITPSLIFYVVDREARASDYFTSWTLQLSHLLLEPSFYARWLSLVQSLMGMAVLIAALLGVLIATRRNRAMLLGLWGGYLIYGLFLPYQMYTHSYYHEQLIPIIALSLVPVVQAIMQRMQQQSLPWQLLVVPVLLAGIAFPAWESIAAMKAENHRVEPAYWQKIASYLPTDGKILALTQDYGYRLMYYGWRKVVLWPNRGEIKLSKLRGIPKEFQSYFAKQIQDKSYFLITAFNQYNDQEDLKQMLSDNYPVYAQGNGYLIFDLTHPLNASAPAASP
ncbi:MAG: glycosyltransferase family 39 protein [Anaerolineales bacterium]|jgi:4-amino-4-deoxy-L-arabinose transferase-like glycosyltransferase